jgi:hypothetical protein
MIATMDDDDDDDYALDHRHDICVWNADVLRFRQDEICYVQRWSDGGCRSEENITSYGWFVKGWTYSDVPFILAAGARYFVYPAASSMGIESEGMLAAWNAIHSMLSNKWKTSLQYRRRVKSFITNREGRSMVKMATCLIGFQGSSDEIDFKIV